MRRQRAPRGLSLILATLALAAGGACFASGGDLTASGKGKPQLVVEFPATVAPASTEDLVLDVSNPGPGDMDSVLVAFTHVGVPGSGLGEALVPFASGGENPAVQSVDPEPESVSEDGVVYRFAGLAAGESTTITFSLVMPSVRGPASNSVQVYDGSEVDRAVGERVSTTVQG